MTLSNALRELLHRSNSTQMSLSKKAGYNTGSAISTPIAKNDMHVSTLMRLADAAGYDVMLVRRSALEPEYPIRIDSAGKAVRNDSGE